MAAVVEALLTNGAAVASRCLVLLVGMFSDVMPLGLVSSVKASVANSTQKAARLMMNVLSMPLQHFLASKLLPQSSQTGLSPWLLGKGTGEGCRGGGGKSTVTSVGQANRCVFKCLAKWSFL